MKTLLLFLLISISAFSQKKMVLIEGFQGHEISVQDSVSEQAVVEFFYFADRLKLDFETDLIGIKKVVSVPMSTFKNAYFDRGTIYISSYADKFPNIKKALILYELGHYYTGMEKPIIILDADNEQRYTYKAKYYKDLRRIMNQLKKEQK